MGDMGLGFGFGVGGASDALSRIFQQRVMAAQVLNQQRQIEAMNNYRQMQQQNALQWHEDQVAQRRDAANEANAVRADLAAVRSATLRPAGAFVTPEEQQFETAHHIPQGLYTPTPASNGYGVLESGQSLPQAGTGVLQTQPKPQPMTPAGFTFNQTQAEADKQAELERKQAADSATANYRNLTAGIAQQNADTRSTMAGIAGELADLKGRLADQKATQPAKLPQREDDTVVSIHQMMPMIDELLQGAQSRIGAQPKPQGFLGQLETRAKRAGEVALYKTGIAQSPDTDKRIQLASLLQILGTVPYLRGIRNMQFVNQIQQHLADPAATDESTVERLQTLKRILPQMEQAIYDVHNGGVIPHAHTGAMAPGGGQEFNYVNGKLVPVGGSQ